VLTIEFSEPQTSLCDCCAGTTTILTRFVYKDGDAYAIYYAAFSDNHPDGTVKMAVGLGEWGEGADASARVAFALDLRVFGDQFEVMVTDAAQSQWSDAEVLGTMLDRKAALAHPWIREVFHIVDHLVLEDSAVREYLERRAVN
jgi:hypothetical protein